MDLKIVGVLLAVILTGVIIFWPEQVKGTISPSWSKLLTVFALVIALIVIGVVT